MLRPHLLENQSGVKNCIINPKEFLSCFNHWLAEGGLVTRLRRLFKAWDLFNMDPKEPCLHHPLSSSLPVSIPLAPMER